MHRICEAQTLLDAAVPQALIYLGRDVEEATASGDVEPQFFSTTLDSNPAQFLIRAAPTWMVVLLGWLRYFGR
jgi:hypothetical protein